MKVLLIYSIIILLLLSINNAANYLGNKQVENCVACKFIWNNIEEALSNGPSKFLSEDKRNPILAAQSFQYFCRIAPDIFFEPCNLMFEKLFYMTQDFCSKKNVLHICIDNDMCINKLIKAEIKCQKK